MLTELPVQVVHFVDLDVDCSHSPLLKQFRNGTDPTWLFAFDQPCLLGCPVLWPAVGTQNHPIVTPPHLIVIIVHRVRQSTKMNILPHVNLSDPSPGLHRLSAQTQPASRLALA